MIEALTDYLIKRRMKKNKLEVVSTPGVPDEPKEAFKRVLNTLRENKVMVLTKDDGIYVRMAGDVNKGECFSLEMAKVVSF